MAHEADSGPGDWTHDVPKQLQKVISDLRDDYVDADWKFGTVTQDACFAHLHGRHQDIEHKKIHDLAEALDQVQINNFNEGIHQGTLPAIVSAYYCLYQDRMTVAALRFFNEVLGIADARAAEISTNADEWAEKQTLHVIRSRWRSIVSWVMWVCDRETVLWPLNDRGTEFNESDPHSIHLLELTGGKRWLAPKFLSLSMEGRSVFALGEYNNEGLWERSDALQSRCELERFANIFVYRIKNVIQNTAKTMRLERAKSSSAKPETSRKGDAVTSEQVESSSSWRDLTPEEVWERLDWSLVNHKVFQIWEEMHPKRAQDRRDALGQVRRTGNSGSYLVLRSEMELVRSDELATQELQACVETWRSQGFPLCPSLYRVFSSHWLEPLFPAIEARFERDLQMEDTTVVAMDSSVSAIRAFAGRLCELRRTWDRRLQQAEREAEQALRKLDTSEAAIGRTEKGTLSADEMARCASTFSWKELESRFRELQQVPPYERLAAGFTRTHWHSGFVSNECYLRGNSTAKQQFEQFATMAARKLGFFPRDRSVNFWLDRVREWMESVKLKSCFEHSCSGSVSLNGPHGKTSGLETERIAEVSAVFCVDLISLGTPEQAVENSGTTTPPKKSASQQRDEELREALIQKIKNKNDGEFITRKQAALVLGVKERTIRRLVETKVLKEGHKRSSLTTISVEAHMRSPEKAKRARAKRRSKIAGH